MAEQEPEVYLVEQELSDNEVDSKAAIPDSTGRQLRAGTRSSMREQQQHRNASVMEWLARKEAASARRLVWQRKTQAAVRSSNAECFLPLDVAVG